MNAPEPGPLLRRIAPPPDRIEALSVERLSADAGDLPWHGDDRRLALQIAYAVGDASILPHLVIAPDAIEAGVAALSAGRPVVADVRMVASGIDRAPAATLGVAIHCRIDDADVIAAARERRITRAAQAMLAQAERLTGAVVAIGNAPTALLAVLDLIDAGMARPALVLGLPVGYVAATEAKDELTRRNVPFVTVRGRRGGTPMAVSAVNTLLRFAIERRASGSASEALAGDAVLFVGHGSRAEAASGAMQQVVAEVTERGPFRIVETAYLEMVSPTIAEGLAKCVERGARRIVAVPYFLHRGMHIQRDIPRALIEAAGRYPGLHVSLSEPIGFHAALVDVMLDRALRGLMLDDVRATFDPAAVQ